MNTSMPAARPRGQTGYVCPKSGPGLGSVDPWKLIELVTDLRSHLGLSIGDISILRAHLSILPKGDLRPENVNASFARVSIISARSGGMSERSITRSETRLAEMGFFKRSRSANGRRFCEKDSKGQVVNAYGIDMSPIFEKYAELRQMQEEIKEERLALSRRKNALSVRLHDILRALSSVGRELPEWAETLAMTFRNVTRRKTAVMSDLDELERKIEALSQEAFDQGQPTTGHDITSLPSLKAPQEKPPATAVANHTTGDVTAPDETELLDGQYPLPSCAVDPSEASGTDSMSALEDKTTANDGQNVRHIESKQNNLKKEKLGSLDFRDLAIVWSKTTTLRELFPDIPRHEHQLAALLIQFSSFIGVGQAIVAKGLCTLGWEKMILVLDYLSSKAAEMRRPEAYLTSMLRNYEQGQTIASGRVVPL